jgi:MFS transporter, ACS family, glucarate transporter
VALTVSYFPFGHVSSIFFTLFCIYLNKVRGLDLKSSAFFGMLPFLAMATFSPVGGYLSDRLTKRYGQRVGRRGISVACMAVAAALCMAGSLAWLLVNPERVLSRRAIKVESQPALS